MHTERPPIKDLACGDEVELFFQNRAQAEQKDGIVSVTVIRANYCSAISKRADFIEVRFGNADALVVVPPQNPGQPRAAQPFEESIVFGRFEVRHV